MKAIVGRTYGPPDNLELQDVDKPLVDDDSVLVRVRAASVNAYDVHFMRGHPYVLRMSEGLRKPKQTVLGVDLAGEVDAVGKNVTKFKPGDEVYGERSGAFAEYVCATERRFALKPASLSFEQAAAVPMAGLTALQGLRDKGQIKPGQRVLVHGASGGVGTFAVQVAKAFGAEVTGVCSTANVDLVRSIGADHVIDHTREDFSRSGERYDLILAVAANRSLSAFRRVLVANGTFVLVGAPNGRWIGPVAYPLKAMVLSRFVSQQMLPFLAKYSPEDMLELTRLVDEGKIAPVIDRSYSLKEVPEAMGYVEIGHAKGKVVITV